MISGGILSDQEIAKGIECGSIRIDPYNPEQLNPVSYDLTLGDEVRIYKRWATYNWNADDWRLVSVRGQYLDLKEKDEPETTSFSINTNRGLVLKPGIGYLMHTCERIWTERYVPVVDGKSSIGRLFILIHFTAGYGDPGFDGQYTLEVSCLHPVKIYPGMRIGQIRFHSIQGEVRKPYQGNYVGEAAQGAVASRAWKQFR